jgi:hypothetical protein
MKVNTAGKYKVSFNTSIGDYEVGESRANTIDYFGNDILELYEEVIADSPEFPMVFKEVTEEYIVGIFYEAIDPEYPVAVMYKGCL